MYDANATHEADVGVECPEVCGLAAFQIRPMQAANMLLRVKRYIQKTYPFWNRTQVRHMGAGGGIRGV